MKIKDIFGLTTYWVYGGGKGHYATEATEKFKLHRAFVGNYVVTKGNLDLRVEPTWQNFKYDTYLKQLKDKGITTVWSTQGSFDWYGTQGKIGKVNPIKPGDDPLLQSSCADFQELVRQITIRYADDTAHLLSEAKVFQGEPAYLSNTPKAGLGLVDYLTGTNEYTFLHGWSGAEYTLTPEMGAVQTKALIDGVRSVSKTMKIVCPSDHTPNIDNQRRLLKHLKSLYEAEGKPMPTDFYLDFHWYMRNTSQDQSGGTAGETPETINAYAHAQAMDALCEEYGLLGWLCTETGWATDNSKQSAPILEGFTREQSQGILMIRLALIWGASKYCKGISFWHCRDDYDLPPYAKGGINNKDWSAKPARTICEEFLDKYGEYQVQAFSKLDNAYAIKWEGLYSGLVWTDKKNYLQITPMPQDTDSLPEPPTPPMRHPKKQGSTLVWSDTGERIIIRELGSPEALLAKPLEEFKAIIDYAVSVGLNCGYFTLYAGDKYSATLHPYNGTKEVTIPNGTKKQMGNPSSGFNMPKILDIKTKLEYAASKGMLLHLITSEKENHHVRTTPEEQAFTDMMVAQLDHLPIIWDKEEVPTGMDGYIINTYTYLQSKTQNVTAIHNNTGEKPWIGHGDIIDLISIQADISSFDSIIKTETANGFAAYASEMTGGFQPNDTAKAARLRDAGGTATSGAGAYIAKLDQDATLEQLKDYEPVFKTLSGTTTPNPTTMKIGYSTKADRSDFKELVSGANLPVGNIYIEAREATPPVVFQLYKEGQSIKQQTENAAPYDSHGGQPFNATAGSYELQVKDKNTPSVGIAFTVGTVTPPPTEVKGTTFVKTIEGKVKFNFEDGIPIIL